VHELGIQVEEATGGFDMCLWEGSISATHKCNNLQTQEEVMSSPDLLQDLGCVHEQAGNRNTDIAKIAGDNASPRG